MPRRCLALALRRAASKQPGAALSVGPNLTLLANTGRVICLVRTKGLCPSPPVQDVLLWGKSPCVLQRLAEVPFAYFVDPALIQARR
jgi:hypothetical protein